MTLYLGIDGGGTKTQAAFFDTDTQTYAYVDGDASRTSAIGWDVSREVLRRLIEQGLRTLGVTPEALGGVSLCLSGIDSLEQSRRMASDLKSFFPNSPIEVVNDALAVLMAGTNGKSGIVLISGTGSVCAAEDESGNTVRAGGYGSLIGDEGSGYDIGRQGLLAAIQSAEGRGPKTVLWERLQEVYGITSANQIIPRIYESIYPLGEIASFAPTVLQLARTDAVCDAIVNGAISSCVGLITSVYERLNGSARPEVVLSGSLFSKSNVLIEGLRKAAPQYRFHVFRQNPSHGAVLRAIRFAQYRGSADSSHGPAQGEEYLWGVL